MSDGGNGVLAYPVHGGEVGGVRHLGIENFVDDNGNRLQFSPVGTVVVATVGVGANGKPTITSLDQLTSEQVEGIGQRVREGWGQ